ncbi:PAX3- and PAX7-binding protein 1 [Melitaea cinxia]|uniref:PAX3- and PAX7-binding protein 1 n=1 Tax=Melitaea cinxia TaxID=113334 RepID=UPI001E26EA92|nr:PAX3- and PAX7-binding protein 1 [Melitaea cinxia]
MSMFRKPKKIQRRVFCADDDDDGDPEPPPPPIISNQTKKEKPVKVTKLLSFADEEEEDGEVFQVKKSSQSKRLAKRREKEKKKVPDGDNDKFDNHSDEEKQQEEAVKTKPKKKITLEGLILSGREALAADATGDVSDESGTEEDSRGFHKYRAESVRAALAVAPGHIPDAALIHAARKTRQQARELGDFVPIQSEAPPGSRLVRDEDGDDDEEEGRIVVRGLELPSDKPKRGTKAALSDEEINSEAEEWEEQQMQKAVPSIADITGEGIELNPFAVAPPPPRLGDAPAHLRPLAAPGQPPPASAHELLRALQDRLSELSTDREATAEKMAVCREKLLCAARTRESRAARTSELDAAYRRAQAARGYVTDLVECLDEKMPQLEALEARALALHRRRCEFLVERRRADVRDQAQDVLALAARPGAAKPVDSEEKRQRTAEREGRRRARRLRREAAGTAHAHRDGDSSDDELPPALRHHCAQETEAIRSLSARLFADALSAWRSVRGVCARMARLRRRQPALYADAYVAHCLPRLLAPYVRHELILWNPLADEDNEDYEKMDWYKCLMMYGVKSEPLSSDSDQSSDEETEPPEVTEDSVRDDPDLMLVPTIIEKVVLPKVTELVEHAWDPMSVRACVRLRRVLLRAAELPGATGDPPRRLAAAVRARLAAALAADVFLPALPPQVLEGAGGAFWKRSLGGGVRLLRAALALCAPPAALAADALALALVETLCCAAGAAPGPQAAAAAAALGATLPRAGALRAAALRRLAALARLALTRLHSDNPLHLKALEQARGVLAEAKAVE